LFKETVHWEKVYENATFSSMVVNPVAGKQGTDMQATVNDEPLNGVICPLSNTADDDGDVSARNAICERVSPDGSEPAQIKIVRKKIDKCEIS
jgi:hypothetical protein